MTATLTDNPFRFVVEKLSLRENAWNEWSYLKELVETEEKNGRNVIRRKWVGVWKNIEGACKRARFFSVGNAGVEGSIPNRI